MSSYINKAINPKTGKLENAMFVDNYYKLHKYGVGFHRRKGKKVTLLTQFHEMDFYPREIINENNGK